MNINWKLRFQNKVTLTAIVLAVIGLVYQVLGLFGVVAPISQEAIVAVAGSLINVFVLLGIVVDPTTEGVHDSARSSTYDCPAPNIMSENIGDDEDKIIDQAIAIEDEDDEE